MLLRKVFIIYLVLVSKVSFNCAIKSNVTKITFYCSDHVKIYYATIHISFSLEVFTCKAVFKNISFTNFTFEIESVFSENNTKVKDELINSYKALNIEDEPQLNFLPLGIKKNLPKLEVFGICGKEQRPDAR